LFEKVDIVDLQRAYIEGDAKGVEELIRKRLMGGDVTKDKDNVRDSEVSISGDGFKKEESKMKKVEVKERLDTGSFW
jgi:hypothetical protein